jgi:hypothetical protein
MSNNLIINNKNFNLKELIFQSKTLGINFSFDFDNVEWMDLQSFVISATNKNCVFEGKFWTNINYCSGANQFRILGKVFLWDNTSSGHITKTYVSVMNISSESLNHLRENFNLKNNY